MINRKVTPVLPILLLQCSGLLCHSAFADNWTVGMAALHADGPYLESKTIVAPLIMYERHRLSLSTLDGVSYRVLNMPEEYSLDGTLSVTATPRIAPDYGDESIYSSIDRKHGLDLGLAGELKFGDIALEIRALSDVTSAYQGFEVSTEVKYQPDSLPIEFGFGAKYRDKNLNQYLFGINSVESTADLPIFSASSELSAFATGMVGVPLSEALIAYGKAMVEDLGSLSKSPLVSDDIVIETMLGVIYQWK